MCVEEESQMKTSSSFDLSDEELALRLKYAGVESRIERDTASALAAAIESTPQGETLYVIPTYTAMLDVRELLAQRASKRPFWEQAS